MTRSTIRHKILVGIAAVALVGGGVALAVTKPWESGPPAAAPQLAASLELAAGEGRVAYDARVQADPFVVHGIVTAETHEIDAKRTIPALAFLRAAA